MRLFFAVTFDEQAQAQLIRMQSQLKTEMIRGRLVRQDNLHLTLDFIGEVKEEGRIEELKQQLVDLPAMPNTLTLSGYGRFKQGLVWAGVVEDKTLAKLQHELRARLIKLGCDIESREYRPHITLGRNLRLKVAVSDLQQLELTLAPKAVALMESTHINDRLVYRPVAQFPLDRSS